MFSLPAKDARCLFVVVVAAVAAHVVVAVAIVVVGSCCRRDSHSDDNKNRSKVKSMRQRTQKNFSLTLRQCAAAKCS